MCAKSSNNLLFVWCVFSNGSVWFRFVPSSSPLMFFVFPFAVTPPSIQIAFRSRWMVPSIHTGFEIGIVFGHQKLINGFELYYLDLGFGVKTSLSVATHLAKYYYIFVNFDRLKMRN